MVADDYPQKWRRDRANGPQRPIRHRHDVLQPVYRLGVDVGFSAGDSGRQFTPNQLRHLASLMEADSPGMRARRRLDQVGLEMLADLLEAGKVPTVGFWRRYSPEPPADPPEVSTEMAVAT